MNCSHDWTRPPIVTLDTPGSLTHLLPPSPSSCNFSDSFTNSSIPTPIGSDAVLLPNGNLGKPQSEVGVAGAVWVEGKEGIMKAMTTVLTQNLAKHPAPIFAHAG
ncbi:hypothetical protein E2C01_095009 [Portunus trituberculatus]|uniref:Uncharacterized protein n=1 Tax=Portunus trituberculatus TaxID=210409 RepID=A0A5B7JZ41_PORTR|nr:hypothetical protein [Portunus trituberculatus]